MLSYLVVESYCSDMQTYTEKIIFFSKYLAKIVGDSNASNQNTPAARVTEFTLK